MNFIKRIWQRYPSLTTIINRVDLQYDERPIGKYVLFGGCCLYLGGAFLIPYWFNQSYLMSSISMVISLVMLILFSITILKCHFKTKRTDQVIHGVVWLGIIGQLVMFGWVFVAKPSMQPSVIGLRPHTTYVTYVPECEYCKAAHHNLQRAVQMYDRTHFKPVEVVDLDANNQLTKDLKFHLKYNGSVITYTDNDHFTPSTVYTQGNAQGKPQTPSVEHIYQNILGARPKHSSWWQSLQQLLTISSQPM